MLSPAWIMVLLHFWVGLHPYVIMKRAFRELECPKRLLPPFKGEQLWMGVDKWADSYLPKGQALGTHMVGRKY